MAQRLGSGDQTAADRVERAQPSGGAAARLRALLETVARSWRALAASDETTIALWIIMLCVLVRLLWLKPVEIWGDAGQTWHFARQLAYANDFGQADWTHHMGRLGLVVPVSIVQRIFGTSPSAYYIVPVAAFTLQVLFVYLIGGRLGGRAGGVLCALMLTFFTGMNRSSSELLPDAIAGAVLAALVYLLINFCEETETRRRRYYLVGVGLLFAWVYAIKESNMLLLPGIMLSIWLTRRSVRDVCVFGAVVAGYVLLETAGFAVFTKYAHRLAIVTEGAEYEPIQFVQLFDRFTTLRPEWQMLLWVWVPCAFWLSWSPDRRTRPVVDLPVTFLLLITFLVRSIDPIVPWVGNKSRYFAGIVPFMVLAIGLFLTRTVERLRETHPGFGWSKLEASVRRAPANWTMALCAILGLVVLLSERDALASHPLRKLKAQTAILNDAYRRNLPIVERNSPPRGLNTVYAVMLRDKHLSQSDVAKHAWLPDIRQAVKSLKVEDRRYYYVLLNERAYEAGELTRLLERGCAIQVGTRNGQVTVSSKRKLRASCKAPRGTPLPR